MVNNQKNSLIKKICYSLTDDISLLIGFVKFNDFIVNFFFKVTK